jgi:pimeloyl-ACP methyl ester carboxylesterase
MFNPIFVLVAGAAILLTFGQTARAAGPAAAEEITVVLVHGAFAESSSWDGVNTKLAARGYRVLAVANPLRGLKTDSDCVGTVLGTIKGPVVLVGHSYGGSVGLEDDSLLVHLRITGQEHPAGGTGVHGQTCRG